MTVVYFVVLIALLCLGCKGFCGKKISTYAKDATDAFLFNLARLVLCVLIGLIVLFAEGTYAVLPVEGGMLGICALAGASNAVFLVTWMLAVQKNTMVSVDVTLTLGSLLPAILCAILFAESISIQKMLGFFLIFFAAFILAGYHKGDKKKTSPLGIILLVCASLGDGMTGFSQQLFKQYYTENGIKGHGVFYPDSVYHAYTYIFAAIFLMLLLVGVGVWRRIQKKEKNAPRLFKERCGAFLKSIPYILVMAICLFAANYAQTLATGTFGMPSQILYPVIKGGCLILANITALFFGERFTKRSALGTGVALCGILLMNLL